MTKIKKRVQKNYQKALIMILSSLFFYALLVLTLMFTLQRQPGSFIYVAF